MIFFLTKYKIKKITINNNGKVICLNAKNNTHANTIVWINGECFFATSYSLSSQGDPSISGLSGKRSPYKYIVVGFIYGGWRTKGASLNVFFIDSNTSGYSLDKSFCSNGSLIMS